MYQDNMRQGLYDPSLEHDNCGIGAVVNIKGLKSHETVSNALKLLKILNIEPARTPRVKRVTE